MYLRDPRVDQVASQVGSLAQVWQLREQEVQYIVDLLSGGGGRRWCRLWRSVHVGSSTTNATPAATPPTTAVATVTAAAALASLPWLNG